MTKAYTQAVKSIERLLQDQPKQKMNIIELKRKIDSSLNIDNVLAKMESEGRVIVDRDLGYNYQTIKLVEK